MLLQVQRSGDSGSPRVEGSTSLCMAASNWGSSSVRRLRPAPGRRTRGAGSFTPAANCFFPRSTVVLARPVARTTAASPPRPSARASLAAQSRRCRSSSAGESARYFLRMLVSTARSMPHIIGPSGGLVLVIYLRSLSIQIGTRSI